MPKTSKNGYTIVEVLIFMAISGMMFIMAANFISGKQGKAEFRDSLFELNSKLQDTINDVSNGYYPTADTQKFTCSAPGAAHPTINAGGSVSQGQHKACVFMGKVLHFDVDSSDYKIYTIVGRQYAASPPAAAADTYAPANFSEAKPWPVDNGQGRDLTEYSTIKWQVQPSKLYDKSSGSPVDLKGFGFFSGFSSSAGGDTLQSGSQSINVVLFTGNGHSPNLQSEFASPSNLTSNTVSKPDIVMCLTDGDHFGTITIGGGRGQKLSTKAQIYASLPPGC